MGNKSILVVAVILIANTCIYANFTLTGTEHLNVSTATGEGRLYDSSSADIIAWGNIAYAYLYNNSQLRLIEPYSYIGNCLYAYGSSQVTMAAFPSDIANLLAYNESTINIHNGNVGLSGAGGGMEAYDNSTMNITGGQVRGLGANGTSTVNIFGNGSVSMLSAREDSTVNVSEGSIVACQVSDNSIMNISGNAHLTSLDAYDFSQVAISGGDIFEELNAYNSSQVMISGGGFWRASVVNAYHSSQIIFEGSDFVIDGVQVAFGQYFASDFEDGLITGTLSNNDRLNYQFSIYDNASIILIPEPTTLLLLAFGGLLLRKKNKKRV